MSDGDWADDEVIDGGRVDRFQPRRALRLSIKMAREIWRLLRMWRLLVIREPPSDSDGERQRWINGQRVAPQYLWEVGCRVYQTAVIDCVRAWRMKAGWRADWRGVPDLAGWEDGPYAALAIRGLRRASPTTWSGMATESSPSHQGCNSSWVNNQARAHAKFSRGCPTAASAEHS